MTPEREADIRWEAGRLTLDDALWVPWWRTACNDLLAALDEAWPERDALRQQLTDLQAIIGKQEEELHQAELARLAVMVERDEALAEVTRLSIVEDEWAAKWLETAKERDEALALAAVLREALEAVRQRAVEHDESNSAYLGCAGTGGIAYVSETALESTPAAAYAELQALREVAATAWQVQQAWDIPEAHEQFYYALTNLSRLATAEGGRDE